MALVTKTYTFSSGATIVASEHNTNFDTLYNLVNGNITNVNIDASAAIADTKLAQITASDKVHFSSLVASSEAQGDVAYFNGTNWVRLGAGTAGYVLQTAGASANPDWAPGVPTGSTISYAGSSAPSGWLLCDGSAVSRTTYSALFTVVSTTYGVGDGSTTFNVPDLRGRFSLGKDNMGGSSANRVTAAAADTVGSSGGAETVTLTTTELPAHTHSTPAHGHTMTVGTEGSSLTYQASGKYLNENSAVSIYRVAGTSTTLASDAIPSGGSGTTGSAGSGSAFSQMNPYLTLNYIIKT